MRFHAQHREDWRVKVPQPKKQTAQFNPTLPGIIICVPSSLFLISSYHFYYVPHFFFKVDHFLKTLNRFISKGNTLNGKPVSHSIRKGHYKSKYKESSGLLLNSSWLPRLVESWAWGCFLWDGISAYVGGEVDDYGRATQPFFAPPPFPKWEWSNNNS